MLALIFRAVAISWFDCPWASSLKTSVSRSVSGSTAVAAERAAQLQDQVLGQNQFAQVHAMNGVNQIIGR